MNNTEEEFKLQKIMAIIIMVLMFICCFPLFVFITPFVVVLVCLHETHKYFNGK